MERKQQGNSQQGIILEPRTEIEEEEKDHCSQPMISSNNHLFGISYHLDSHLLVKSNDLNKDNTCNENPEDEEDLSVEGGGSSSCMVTPLTEIIHKKHLNKSTCQDKQQPAANKMDSTLSSNSHQLGSSRLAATRTRKQAKELLEANLLMSS